jgi:hypothetical protein
MHVFRGFLITSLVGTALSQIPFQSKLVFAKGLNELSDANPENASDAVSEKSTDETKTEAGTVAAANAAPMAKSAASESLADKLVIGTSYGWIKASKSTGVWKSNGMSDVTVAYLLPISIGPEMPLYGSYRYAPIAVTVVVDDHSFRGILEGHYFGCRTSYTINQNLHALGAVEFGYMKVNMHDTDELGADEKYKTGGMSIVLGGGADWGFGEKSTWAAGPRVNVGFGSFTTIQVAGAATFKF